MRTRSQPISPNGFQSLQTPPRRKRTLRQTAPSTGSPKQNSNPEPKTETAKVTKRAPPKNTGRKRKAPPRKKQTAAPAQENKQPEASPKQPPQQQHESEREQQQHEPSQEQHTKQKPVLTENENAPGTPARKRKTAGKNQSSTSRKRSRQSLDETESESNAKAPKRPYVMPATIASQRQRDIRPYAERRHRLIYGPQESIHKTLLDLPRLRAQYRGENKENVDDSDELLFTPNYPRRPAPGEELESPLQQPLQQPPATTQASSEPAPTTPDQPSRWSFRNFFGSVPQTLSRVLSPLRTAGPATPATPVDPPTPAAISSTPGIQQQGTQNQATSPVQQEQTETQPQRRIRDLTYSPFPPPFRRLGPPRPQRPAKPAQPAQPAQTAQNTQNAQPTTPAKKPKTRKRKRDSPEVIPNPPGGGYGMHPDYFYIDSDDEDEDEDGDQATRSSSTNEPDTPFTGRPKKRVRFAESPQNTPSRARSSEAVTETAVHAHPGSSSVMGHGALLAPSSPATAQPQRSSPTLPENHGGRQPATRTRSRAVQPSSSPRLRGPGAWPSSSSPGTESDSAQQSSAVQQQQPPVSPATLRAEEDARYARALRSADENQGPLTREEIHALARARREYLLQRQRELGGQVEFIGLPLVWPPGPDEIDPEPFPRSATGTFELRYEDFSDIGSEEEREMLEYERNLSPAQREELEQWRQEQDRIERIIEQQNIEHRIILQRRRRREQEEREAQQAREAEEARRVQQAREAEEAQRAQQAREAEAEEARRQQAMEAEERAQRAQQVSEAVAAQLAQAAQQPQGQQFREIQEARDAVGQPEQTDMEQQELSRIRSQAERYKPRLPSGLRASKRHSGSPVPPLNWPHPAACGEVPAVDGPSHFSHELGGLSLSLS